MTTQNSTKSEDAKVELCIKCKIKPKDFTTPHWCEECVKEIKNEAWVERWIEEIERTTNRSAL
jgi:hypothetical protein